MRSIYCCFILLLFAFGPYAHATDNGQLYKDCKKLADKSFQPNSITDIVCIAYFRAVLDSGISICDTYGKSAKSVKPGIQRDERNWFKRLEGVGSDVNIEAAVQIYVNKMAKKPEKWKYRADYEVLSSLQELAPCE